MRSDVVRLYKVVHTWTGITTGMFLFIAFYAGSITVFAEPLARWVATPAPVRLTPLAQSDELIARTLAARPDAAKEFTLHLGMTEDLWARLTWRKTRDDKAPWSADLSPKGDLQLSRSDRSSLADFVDNIHRTAGIPGAKDIGETIMGVVSAVYAVALVSGLIIVLPSLVKDLFAFRIGPNLKRMWLDAHNVVGVVSLPFHIVIALTAVVFCLHEQLYDALDHVVYDGGLKSVIGASNPFTAIKKDDGPAPMQPVDALLERVKATSPSFVPVEMRYRSAGSRGASVQVWGYDTRYMTRGKGFAVLSPVTGEIANTDYLPGKEGTWTGVVATFFALHFATFGGDIVRACYFLLGLAGAFLFYSGNLLWIESRRRTERRNGGPVDQKTSTRMLSSATVGVCLGAICAISISIVAAKWANGRVANIDAWHNGVYYSVFLASVLWSFIRGGARASVELLWLAALATAAIPLTTLASWILPALRLQPSASMAALGVDLVALGAALSFVWMAIAAARRVKFGPADSVWAAPRGSAEKAREITTPCRQLLETRFGNNVGSDRWWRRVAAEGCPIISTTGKDRARVSFLWRDPQGDRTRSTTRSVFIDVCSVTDHHGGGPVSLERIGDSDVWHWSFEVEADWRGSYSFIPVDDEHLPPSGGRPDSDVAIRKWWRSALTRAQTDPLNPGVCHVGLRGQPFSAVHLPKAPFQRAWRDVDRKNRPAADPSRLRQLSWDSARLRNTRRIWIFRTGEAVGARELPLVLLLDGQYWAEAMPIFSALDNDTQAGLLPPCVYVLIDSLDADMRMRELACDDAFLEAVQHELLPLVARVAPCVRDPRRTVIAGQSLGGLAALFAGLRAPERFGCVLAQSGSFWWPGDYARDGSRPQLPLPPDDTPDIIASLIENSESSSSPLRVFLEAGSFEKVIRPAGDRIHLALTGAGHDVRCRIYTGGHDPLCWRGGLLDGLSFLLADHCAASARAAATQPDVSALAVSNATE
ncbi:MAG: enterochelin esterase [Methylocystis sp.]|uniref:enterochelin esterase n=1 Tax=Methylocystis sp. TaxID=1911079 RepID=UPI003D10E7B2